MIFRPDVEKIYPLPIQLNQTERGRQSYNNQAKQIWLYNFLVIITKYIIKPHFRSNSFYKGFNILPGSVDITKMLFL